MIPKSTDNWITPHKINGVGDPLLKKKTVLNKSPKTQADTSSTLRPAQDLLAWFRYNCGIARVDSRSMAEYPSSSVTTRDSKKTEFINTKFASTTKIVKARVE